MSDSDKSDKKVEVFHRVNKLKLKAGAHLHDGPGYIDPHAIERAQTVVQKRENLYRNEVEENLKRLSQAWEKLKSADASKIEEGKEELFHYANHIKDLAATYRYELMKDFGQSLRSFCEKIDTDKKEHLAIVQAHIDVMMVAYKQNIKDNGGEQAIELKAMVDKAIEKYM